MKDFKSCLASTPLSLYREENLSDVTADFRFTKMEFSYYFKHKKQNLKFQ